jgi:hypothetical protein
MRTVRNIMAILAVAAATGMAASASGYVIFSEDFGDPPGGVGAGMAPNAINWFGYANSGATDSSGTSGDIYIVDAGTANQADLGYLAMNNPSIGLAYTEKAGSVPVALIESLSFRMNNRRPTDAVKVAVRIGGNWYASAQTYHTTTNNDSLSDWTNAVSVVFNWDPSPSAWYNLSFTPGSTLALMGTQPGAALSGNVDAFGFYMQRETAGSPNNGTLRIDDLVVTAVPEPSSLALLAAIGAIAACFRLRRRTA